jgi:hypothetical protein
MKQKFAYLLYAVIASSTALAQSQFYGIARKATSSSEIYLASINSSTGLVSNISTSSLGTTINLTGAALDPYNNYFHFIGGNNIKSVNLTTGNVVTSVPLYNPIAASYFDNFRFNHSDTSLYGLARRVVYDTVTMSSTGEVYLAKVNVTTGVISQISTSSVGQGYTIGGSAIDPYQKVFYYTTGLRFVGLDMYTGSIWSDVPITITDGIMFDNVAYSCRDTGIYGLIRQNYFSIEYPDPTDSSITNEVLDSSTIKLGRIDPSTGVVTTISPYTIDQGGYSLNSGATINADSMLYYYNKGYELVAVSLTTGLVVSRRMLSYTDGDYFELMRHRSNCIEATSPRRLPTTSVNSMAESGESISVFPNPAAESVTVANAEEGSLVEVIDAFGRVLIRRAATSDIMHFDISGFTSGVFTVRVSGQRSISISKMVKQ